ncbi:MAG TPA: PAS domain-containing protein [Steroidobacteraceae bacterium]|jgi:PAS domain-containing protein|nr:PAS domain-containing protein [Steroidobacteraceae bacterium]
MSTVLDSPLADRRVVSFHQKPFTVANATVAAECSPSAIVLTTLAAQVLYANRAFLDLLDLPSIESILNLDLAQVCGQRLDFQFLSKLARDGQPQQRTLSLMRGGQSLSFVCSATRVAAESEYPKWLSISLMPGSHAEPGNVTSANGAVFERLIGRHGIWSIATSAVIDARNGLIAVNAGFCSMMNWPQHAEPYPLRNWLRVIHRDDRNRVIEALTELAVNGGEYSLQYRLQTGAVDRTIQSTACATARDGAMTFITGVERDVTDLAAHGEAERRQVRLLRALSECVELPAFALDSRGNLLWFNTPFTGFLRPLGVTVVQGQALEEAFPEGPLRRRLRRNLRRALRGEQRVEEILLHTETNERRCDFTFNPVRDDNGDVTAVMTIVTEIIGTRHVIP